MAFVAARRAAAFNVRRYTTEAAPTPKSSNTALYLGLTTVVGIGAAYYYMKDTPEGLVASKVPLTSALDKDKFVDFKLKKIEPYNHNTSKYIFETPKGTASLLPVAACVVIKTSPEAEDPAHPPLLNDKGKPFVRPYTPISPSDTPEEITFLIKKYETGKVTPYLHDMKPGQTVAIKGPIPKIPYQENQFEHVGMIAGGSGLTPMYQILQHALTLPNDKTKFTFIYSNVSEKDILLKETLDGWAKKYPDRLKMIYALDKGDDNWKGLTGLVTAQMVKENLPAPSDKVKILVCGPPGQVASLAGPKDKMEQGPLAGALKELGYTSEQVFKF